ncbi:MAG: hypothetical protein IPP77_06520 [Bacteroidetes bacterium]|nr:hypothetical protein [Bacteroidota bacterium]
MDISVYISELLWDHDCVIIPGFGGLICNYKPAAIEAVTHRVSPPSKAISFNKNLQKNDGLLVNYICGKKHLLFSEAMEGIQKWVESSNALIRGSEEVRLRNIGTLSADIEGNIQFAPDESLNYLKTSFGLKSFVAEPVLREKNLVTIGRKLVEKSTDKSVAKGWKIAAAVLLVGGISVLFRMMSVGVEIKPLKLDEAGVMNFVNQIFYVDNKPLNPLPVEMDEVSLAETDNSLESETAINDESISSHSIRTEGKTSVVSSSVVGGYYVIVGAFRQPNNVEAAKRNLRKDFKESEILVLRNNGLTKVGYFAGTDRFRAEEVLVLAKQQDSTCWMMHR